MLSGRSSFEARTKTAKIASSMLESVRLVKMAFSSLIVLVLCSKPAREVDQDMALHNRS